MALRVFTAPAAWERYLLYGDETGLSDLERHNIEQFISSVPGVKPLAVAEVPEHLASQASDDKASCYMHFHDAIQYFGPCVCMWYIYQVQESE